MLKPCAAKRRTEETWRRKTSRGKLTRQKGFVAKTLRSEVFRGEKRHAAISPCALHTEKVRGGKTSYSVAKRRAGIHLAAKRRTPKCPLTNRSAEKRCAPTHRAEKRRAAGRCEAKRRSATLRCESRNGASHGDTSRAGRDKLPQGKPSRSKKVALRTLEPGGTSRGKPSLRSRTSGGKNAVRQDSVALGETSGGNASCGKQSGGKTSRGNALHAEIMRGSRMRSKTSRRETSQEKTLRGKIQRGQNIARQTAVL